MLRDEPVSATYSFRLVSDIKFINAMPLLFAMKILLVKPPRKLWPYLNEDDNFLLPQALPCLAAVLRENGIDVGVIDCSPLKIGWKTLEMILRRKQPDIVGISEPETMWSNEGVKLADLVKRINPKTITVAGGTHFSNYAIQTLKNTKIDIVVVGEGEITIVDLVNELSQEKPNLKRVEGIIYKSGNSIVKTKPRKLIENLDFLPLPAYDLMPMDKYGKSQYIFHPGGTTIHHSRGCPFSCDFCICWKQMAQHMGNRFYPKWRTKSVKNTIEEIKLLYYKYRKRGFVFTDDNWNFDSKWNEEFANAVIKEGLDINWFAFMRADHLIRDESKGILKKLVRAGLSHISIGVEREFDSDLRYLHKKIRKDIIKKAFKILRKKYPQVFSQGTFIIGLRNETPQSLKNLVHYIKELDMDYPSFSPITPVPGTKTWEEANKKWWVEVEDFEKYDWFTPIISPANMTRQDIEDALYKLNRSHFNTLKILRNLISPYKYKRKMYTWFLIVSLRLLREQFKDKVSVNPNNLLSNLYTPKWYYK
jgi:anaerobic magnesium-protoporphyrin IX monomethyl ester cyclase